MNWSTSVLRLYFSGKTNILQIISCLSKRWSRHARILFDVFLTFPMVSIRYAVAFICLFPRNLHSVLMRQNKQCRKTLCQKSGQLSVHKNLCIAYCKIHWLEKQGHCERSRRPQHRDWSSAPQIAVCIYNPYRGFVSWWQQWPEIIPTEKTVRACCKALYRFQEAIRLVRLEKKMFS